MAAIFEISGVEVVVLIEQFEFRKTTLHRVDFGFEKLLHRILKLSADFDLVIDHGNRLALDFKFLGFQAVNIQMLGMSHENHDLLTLLKIEVDDFLFKITNFGQMLFRYDFILCRVQAQELKSVSVRDYKLVPTFTNFSYLQIWLLRVYVDKRRLFIPSGVHADVADVPFKLTYV